MNCPLFYGSLGGGEGGDLSDWCITMVLSLTCIARWDLETRQKQRTQKVVVRGMTKDPTRRTELRYPSGLLLVVVAVNLPAAFRSPSPFSCSGVNDAD